MKTKLVSKVLVTDGEKLLMGRRSEKDINRPGQWDLLGGGGEKRNGRRFETFEETAQREVFEETNGGIWIPKRNLHPVYTEQPRLKVFEEDKEARLILAMYFAGYVELPDAVQPSDEHEEIRRFTVEGAIEATEYGRQRRVLEFVQEHNLLQGAIT